MGGYRRLMEVELGRARKYIKCSLPLLTLDCTFAPPSFWTLPRFSDHPS